MSLVKSVRTALFALPLVLGAGAAQALPVGLALVLDESGSISAANWTLQVNGYVNAITNVVAANGSVAIGVWKFDDTVEQVFPVTTIANATDKTNLINALSGMVQGAGLTAIGDGINAAYAGLNAFGFANLDRAVIDVSTDGANNSGADPVTAAANAVAGGVGQVNCLGIGGAANCGFIAGTGSFSVNANNFAEFQATLENKIRREVGLPEPVSLALFSVGFVGMAAARRKKAA